MARTAKRTIKDVIAKAPIRTGPRKPYQGRGALRLVSLVDATEKLLRNHDPENVGHYQIAKAARISAASVYHFFPTREAAFMALAERYLRKINELLCQPIEAASIRSWRDLLAVDQRRVMTFYNAHTPSLKIFYGGFGSLQGWQSDLRFTAGIAASHVERLSSAFDLPEIRDLTTKSLINLGILDAIGAISYQRHGLISEDFYEEALSACVAYLGLYLPPRIEPRKHILEAAGRGESIVLTHSAE